LPVDSPLARELDALLGESTPDPPGTRATVAIEVEISLASALAAGVDPDDALFVVARAADGGAPPLAVARRRAGELPLNIRLDEHMAMVPGASLATADQVRVLARISRGGNARAAAGDLEGRSAVIDPRHAHKVAVVIDRVIGTATDARAATP
jgi:cytochrome c-type biogenesis protein CcmH